VEYRAEGQKNLLNEAQQIQNEDDMMTKLPKKLTDRDFLHKKTKLLRQVKKKRNNRWWEDCKE